MGNNKMDLLYLYSFFGDVGELGDELRKLLIIL